MAFRLSSHHFARYGEFIVSFELLKRGWNTYTPIYDKRIDLIAHKIERDGSFKFRTIQVRSSRKVNGGKKFGFKIYPQDLFKDPNHFFIIAISKGNKFSFLVMSVEDYKSVMGEALKTRSFKEKKYRHHVDLKTFKEGRKDFSPFLNKFDKLEI